MCETDVRKWGGRKDSRQMKCRKNKKEIQKKKKGMKGSERARKRKMDRGKRRWMRTGQKCRGGKISRTQKLRWG